MYGSSGHALSLDRKKIIRTTLKHFTPNRKFRMLWLDGTILVVSFAVVIEVPSALRLRYLETQQSPAILHLCLALEIMLSFQNSGPESSHNIA